jgi:hypothetical protein
VLGCIEWLLIGVLDCQACGGVHPQAAARTASRRRGPATSLLHALKLALFKALQLAQA